MNAQGAQFAQLRPGGTTAVTLFTADVLTEITRLIACNTTGSPVACRIFHDDDGTTYDQGSALYYDKVIPANDSLDLAAGGHENGGLHVDAGGSIGVRTATSSALTFTAYGVTSKQA